ncbi:hypothetical protein [Pseudoalteromonas sp. PPB1]|uniref:hypothetical protein n=1 Tax=Pseudoalteromonas sp. PPB1 TaxID=2756136 RepID=UPI0018913E66|nr:hypothetical protein [Pseudoalteromonas sp. PPB1]
MTNSTNEINWKVTTNSEWDIAFQKIISYLWDNKERVLANAGENRLFYIMKNLGISNIREYTHFNKDGSASHGVSLLSNLTGKDASQQYSIINICERNEENRTPIYDSSTFWSSKNGWKNLLIDLEVKLPPHNINAERSSVLSDYISMQRFFPFSQLFHYPASSTSSDHIPLNLKIDALVDSSSSHKASGYSNINSAIGNNEVENSDRGGSEGVDDDYSWLHFVPRLISYNWALSTTECIDPVTKPNLRDYPVLLENLGYRVADELNIYLSYASKEPATEEAGEKVYNVNEYTSTLFIDLPAPDYSEDVSPMALADLVAARANQPFTST